LPEGSPDEELLVSASEPHRFDPVSGKIVGKHNGAHFFTIGQRKGINIGGYKEPLFVIGTDIVNNILYVGEGQSHPGLYRKGLFIRIEEVHWIRRDLEMKENEIREYDLRIRYRQPLQKARLYRKEKGIYVIFHKLQRGIAPGQFAAWYNGDELIGSGVIDR
jgi:tRNA-specific 2-thiouridylase